MAPRSVHLEAHVGTLPGGEVGAAGGTGEAGHVVVVSLQEGLVLRAGHIPHDNGSAERVDEVAAVWVHDHAAMDAACKTTAGHRRWLDLLAAITTTRTQLERAFKPNAVL